MRERLRVRSVATWLATLIAGVTLFAFRDYRAAAAATGPEMFVRWTDVPRLPPVGDYRYTLTVRVRPLLVFWITRPDVGDARVVRGQTPDGGRSFELLIGSDPAKAPMRLNRWGYVAESNEGGRSRLVGVMTESTEESVDEGKAALNGRPQRQHAFKAIRANIADGAASAQVVRVAFDEDFTMRDVEVVLTRLPEGGEPTAQIQVPNSASPGFLTALAYLIHADVASARSTGRGTQGRSQAFVYDRGLYDLTLVSSALVRSIQVGSTGYRNCLESDFEIRSRAAGTRTGFHLVYATAGPLAEVPVRIVYRPRWWFEVELTLAGS